MRVRSLRREMFPQRSLQVGWRIVSILFSLAGLILLLGLFGSKLRALERTSWLLLAVIAALSVVILFHTRYLLRARQEHVESDERFQQMASNIQEVFWMIDVPTKEVLYANEAYETITGYSCQSLREKPSSYQDLIHPADRDHVLARLEEATQTGRLDERFRIRCARGEVRWVRVQGFPVKDAAGRICRLVGTAQEITAQKQAEDQVATNLALAESACAEAEALRKATLALTQDLRLDKVLDTLLQCLAEIVPYECARVLLLEGSTRLFLARERRFPDASDTRSHYPQTWDLSDFTLLERTRVEGTGLLLTGTDEAADWHAFAGCEPIRSLLCVPLLASDVALGFLSLAHSRPQAFTEGHLRRAQLLAAPAAAAIQNARLYERAEIYGAELEKNISHLHQTQNALAQAEADRKMCAGNFQAVFRASPVPVSITTLGEGRFLDVNTAFEHRYGYSRSELLGHTVYELRIWDDPADRAQMTAQLQRGEPVRNVITRLRTKSAQLKLTAYSADKIRFQGQVCILAVSADLPPFEPHDNH